MTETDEYRVARIARLEFGIEVAHRLLTGNEDRLNMSQRASWQSDGPRGKAKIPTTVQRARLADTVITLAADG